MYLVLVWHITMLGTQAQGKNIETKVLSSNNWSEFILKASLLLEPILRMQLILVTPK